MNIYENVIIIPEIRRYVPNLTLFIIPIITKHNPNVNKITVKLRKNDTRKYIENNSNNTEISDI